jgi:membrane complex biogenesis BtpA family protein
MLHSLFGEGKFFIGVVHLLPLPGSPRWGGDLTPVVERAQQEALVLQQNGASGIIVENFGDAPFRIGRVPPDTVAGMTLLVDRVKQVTSLPLGINMLRNDALSALAVAVAAGAQFIRVNVHYGIMAADEGMVEGEAFTTLRHRQALGADIKVLADVLVKHAVPLGDLDLGLMARETAYRGLADGLIITGPVTGRPAFADDVSVARRAVPDRLLLVGSGVDADNANQLLDQADGAIIGTSLKRDGVVSNPIDPERVRRVAEVIRQMG